MTRKLRPTADNLRYGPDGIDVYAEEMERLIELGIQWTAVALLRDEAGNSIGGVIHMGGDLKPVTIYGFTDEEP